jgi:hypothetical protein
MPALELRHSPAGRAAGTIENANSFTLAQRKRAGWMPARAFLRRVIFARASIVPAAATVKQAPASGTPSR